MPRIQRKNKRLSRFEQVAASRQRVAYHQTGKGRYIYRNKSQATLNLPKPTAKGQVIIGAGQEWEGDDYYMLLVRTGQAVLVRTVEEPVASTVQVNESVSKTKGESQMLNESKLLLDQPDIVTTKGTVEHVVVDTAEETKKKNRKKEKTESVEKSDVLLVDDSLAGIQILG